jgi:hypothetical protein
LLFSCQIGLLEQDTEQECTQGETCQSTTHPLDQPINLERIELVESNVMGQFAVEYYRNKAYTCAQSGYQTFLLAYRQTDPLETARPLWVRMHGGGTGLYNDDGSYSKPMTFLTEESLSALSNHLQETGLLRQIRQHNKGYRFLIPSMCDHDLYSGVGDVDPNNPNSPDENGLERATDGLYATMAALSFAKERLHANAVFLHGTSAGAIGAFSLAYALERRDILVDGSVLDAHILSKGWSDIVDAGCTDYDFWAIAERIGALLEPQYYPEKLVADGLVSTPLLHVWSRGDEACCGMSVYDASSTTCEHHHNNMRQAIDVLPSTNSSLNMELCVNNPATAEALACDMHSATKIDFEMPSLPGNQDDNGSDYNAAIVTWIDGLDADE